MDGFAEGLVLAIRGANDKGSAGKVGGVYYLDTQGQSVQLDVEGLMKNAIDAF